MTNAIYTGHCLCGDVKLEGRGDPRVDVCHCDMCLHWHGAPGMAVSFANGLSISTGEALILTFDSSEWATRSFCKKCGTTLFYKLKAKDEFSAQAGLFNLPDTVDISEHIFIDEKPGWYDFKGDAPRLTGAETLAKYAGDGSD
ncbi:MAG: GFA family protein [Pseudomonadota bacterium]